MRIAKKYPWWRTHYLKNEYSSHYSTLCGTAISKKRARFAVALTCKECKIEADVNKLVGQ